MIELDLGGPTSADIIAAATASTLRKVAFAVHCEAAAAAFGSAMRD